MTSCGYENKLAAYYDRELSEPMTRKVESHLAQCPACREELATMQDVSRLLMGAPAVEDMTPLELSRLHLAVEEENAGAVEAANGDLGYGFLKPLAALAASVLVICSVWLLALPAKSTAPVATSTAPIPEWEHLAMTLHPEPHAIFPESGMARAVLDDTRLADWMLENLNASN